ncbi:hypothetical protein DQP58_08045 [Mycobacterium colombiense]|uniref:HTH araC/xylS-type domain-containing protein n=1 Tax=Mycobacterium colombiense TaxID=339268 RepID=A0A329KNS7_9MYCO|nr:AraC family transcriptional regulator [Mycobacterium colombiense]RAU97428.1 hypothetical protein DQP58_08045 [Mycobacterium colombiense]
MYLYRLVVRGHVPLLLIVLGSGPSPSWSAPREILASKHHTVSAVASMCGYASTARFTTVRRQRYGLTPGAYLRLRTRCGR